MSSGGSAKNRPAHSIKYAVNEIKRNKGKVYDPDVVEACLKVLKKGYKIKG